MAFDEEAGHLGQAVGLVKFDLKSPDKPVAAMLRFGSGRTGGEAVFVPSSTNAAELTCKHLMPCLKPHSSRLAALDCHRDGGNAHEAVQSVPCLVSAAGPSKEAVHGVQRIERPAGVPIV